MIGIFGRSLAGGKMADNPMRANHQKIQAGVKAAIAQAIERHRKLGESIAIWQDGKVVVLAADQIPAMRVEDQFYANGEDRQDEPPTH